MSNHLFDLIVAKIPDPEKILIQSLDGGSLTYRQMLSASARYAHALAKLGVEPGDRVAMQMEKSPAFLFIYLACVRAGAVFLPLNTAYTPHEVGYFLSDAQPKLIVCDPERADSLALAGEKGRRSRRRPRPRAGRRALRSRRRQPAGFRQCAARRGRPRRHSLYVGNHRALEGRHALA